MCTYLVETADISGSGKGAQGWFQLERAHVAYDHPFHAPLDHALTIDFVNESKGPAARVAVEMTAESARDLVRAITAALEAAEAEGAIEPTPVPVGVAAS